MTDHNNNLTPAEAKKRKQYIGRRALLRLILDREESTQRWIIKRLTKHLTVKKDITKKLLALARKEGVKISRLELK